LPDSLNPCGFKGEPCQEQALGVVTRSINELRRRTQASTVAVTYEDGYPLGKTWRFLARELPALKAVKPADGKTAMAKKLGAYCHWSRKRHGAGRMAVELK